jgi:hypothetical protein
MMESTEEFQDSATLEFSASPDLWTIARLVVTSVANRLDFEIDALDDLRFSVDELCTICAADTAPSDRIKLTVAWGTDTVKVSCEVRPTGSESRGAEGIGAGADQSLSLRILEALTDGFEIAPSEDGLRQGWFTKKSAAASED